MGVQGLTGILLRYAPSSVSKIRANTLSKQTIAIDASCHLNKFVYGDEQVPHRHIQGFYQLARFCQLNKIKPIFVFDGPSRLPAKYLEHAKRARSRRKVKHSLLFERDQTTRLDAWSQVTDMMGTQDPALDIETKIELLSRQLKLALSTVENGEKYTRTVKQLAIREDGLMTDMLLRRLKDAKSSLKKLQRDNHAMTQSLGLYVYLYI